MCLRQPPRNRRNADARDRRSAKRASRVARLRYDLSRQHFPEAADQHRSKAAPARDGRRQEGPRSTRGFPGRPQRTDTTLTHRPTTSGVKQYEFHLHAGGMTAKPYPLAVQVLDSQVRGARARGPLALGVQVSAPAVRGRSELSFSALLHRGGGAFVQFGSRIGASTLSASRRAGPTWRALMCSSWATSIPSNGRAAWRPIWRAK